MTVKVSALLKVKVTAVAVALSKLFPWLTVVVSKQEPK